MPRAQTDYPLTLAEVLFEELELTGGEILPDPGKREIEEAIAELRSVTSGSPDLVATSGADVDLTDSIWKHKTELSSKLVPKIYQLIHKLPSARSALCLSGGGIRSGTFNLGVLQGLARNGQLGEFDFLSTVSGGGFIGSWLTAWIHRAGIDAITELGRPRPVNKEGEPTPLNPEPKPVENLRVYSNYLTPRKGILSADTWTLIAVYLRNLLLNWLVFLPAIMFALMVPRIWAAIVSNVEVEKHPSLYLWVGILGVVAGGVSLVGIMLNLPSIGNKNWRTAKILAVVVVPLCLMAMLLSVLARHQKGAGTRQSTDRRQILGTVPARYWRSLGRIPAGLAQFCANRGARARWSAVGDFPEAAQRRRRCTDSFCAAGDRGWRGDRHPDLCWRARGTCQAAGGAMWGQI